MEITPREYQVQAVENCVKFFKTPKAPPSIALLPTAWGKSILIAFVAKRIEEKVIVVSPTKELLDQNISKFRMLGGRASIYSASFGRSDIGDVTYATIGSIKNIGHIFKSRGFTKMIIDECHLMPRESSSMIGKFLSDSGITHVLGLTATPLKLQTNFDVYKNSYSKLVMLTSRSGKGNFYKNMIHVTQIKELIDLNFWAKLEYELYDIDETGLVYNSTKADFTEASVNKMYALNNTNERIKHAVETCGRKSIIVFVPSVADAKVLATQIPSSVAIYADMDKTSRDWAVNGFKEGRIRVLVNVNIASVGFDHPALDCIICGRSTASLSWYYQALGRLTRIHPSKKDGLIIDFSGNVRRFGKIEHFYYVQERGVWKLYGEGGILLSGVPLHEIGRHTHETEEKSANKPVIMTFGIHKGIEVKMVPKSYRDWARLNVVWNQYNEHIKKELERIYKLETLTANGK